MSIEANNASMEQLIKRVQDVDDHITDLMVEYEQTLDEKIEKKVSRLTAKKYDLEKQIRNLNYENDKVFKAIISSAK
jgi:chromosome segregation ATPase